MKCTITVSSVCAFLCFASPLMTTVEGAQILGLFSHPGKSHFDFFRPLFLGLAEAGHNVTMISYFPNKKPVANYTDLELKGMPLLVDFIDLEIFTSSLMTIPIKIPAFFMLHNWGMKACEVAFNSNIIKDLLNSSMKYDLIILEQFNNDCMMAIAHMLKAPVISMSSCALMPWHYKRMGSPFTTSFMPVNFFPYNDEMDFLERLNNFLHFHVIDILYKIFTQRQTDALIRKHFGTSIPPIEELIKTTSVQLINQHFSLTGAYPYSPNIVEVGGLHIQEEKPLDPKLKTLLDGSTNGVIYVSWGSMVRPETLPIDKRQALLNVINQLPQYTFIMKWSNESLPRKPKNLHTLDWMPQRDLLCHPNVKAFMSHAGLLGSSEATHCGVPMMLTPFYGDQFLNAEAVSKRHLGIIVKYKDFTENNILAALKTIMEPKYLDNARRVSKAYRSRPQTPLQLSMWWVEHVMQTNGAPLAQSSSKNANWFIYYQCDIFVFLLVSLVIFLYLVRFALKKCIRLLSRNGGKKLKQQ